MIVKSSRAFGYPSFEAIVSWQHQLPEHHSLSPSPDARRLLLGKLISPLLPEMQMGRIRVEQVTSDREVQVPSRTRATCRPHVPRVRRG